MGRPLTGTATLPEAAEVLNIPEPTMFEWSRQEWFPEPVAVLAGMRIYDLSMIALLSGTPLSGRMGG